MSENFFNVIIIVAIIVLLSYFLFKALNDKLGQTKIIEGLENNNNNGIASNAAQYAIDIKNATNKITDELLVEKYRKDYETILINMDELLGAILLKELLTGNPGRPNTMVFYGIAQLKTGTEAAMKILDSIGGSSTTASSAAKTGGGMFG